MTDQPIAAMTDEDLLPCPFCGHRAEFGSITDQDNPNFGAHYIQCQYGPCEVSSSLKWSLKVDAKPLLVEAWNRRARALLSPPVPQVTAEMVREICRRWTNESWQVEDYCVWLTNQLNPALAEQAGRKVEAPVHLPDDAVTRLAHEIVRLNPKFSFDDGLRDARVYCSLLRTLERPARTLDLGGMTDLKVGRKINPTCLSDAQAEDEGRRTRAFFATLASTPAPDIVFTGAMFEVISPHTDPAYWQEVADLVNELLDKARAQQPATPARSILEGMTDWDIGLEAEKYAPRLSEETDDRIALGITIRAFIEQRERAQQAPADASHVHVSPSREDVSPGPSAAGESSAPSAPAVADRGDGGRKRVPILLHLIKYRGASEWLVMHPNTTYKGSFERRDVTIYADLPQPSGADQPGGEA